MTDSEERLLGVVTFRDLLLTPGDKTVREVMRADVVTAPADLDQEELSHLFETVQPTDDPRGRLGKAH